MPVPDIHCLPIPTPFKVGRVNVYLIEDEPLTLVDTGPNSGKALDELERQLSDVGHSIDELELVILTHQHIDHLGLIEVIESRSGAEVAAIDVAVDHLAGYSERASWDSPTPTTGSPGGHGSRPRLPRPPPGLPLAGMPPSWPPSAAPRPR